MNFPRLFAFRAFFCVWFSCVVPAFAAAGSGEISGRVYNAAAGSFLARARVTVDGTTSVAFTNAAGEYTLAGVAAGEAVVRVAYLDLPVQTARVRVTAGKASVQDFEFAGLGRAVAPPAGEVVRLAEFTVAERELSAQAAAIQEQRMSPNLRNVVSFEEFGDLGEGNVGEFLKFVPGIQVSMAPAIPTDASIRGMPSGGTILKVDGLELASDNPSVRAAGFTSSNTANIDRVEVTKVPTPDMPANAVGGMINVVSKSGFSRRTPQFTYNAFGTLTTLAPFTSLGSELLKRGGPDGPTNGLHVRPGFDFTYLRPVSPTLAVSVSGGHNARWEDKDAFTPTWNRVSLVQTQSASNAQVAVRERDVAATRVDWKPLPGHTLFGSFQYTRDNVYSRQHAFTTAYGTGATGGPEFTQGAAAGAGTVTQGLTYRDQLKDTGMIAGGWRYENGPWRLDATASYSKAKRRTLSANDDQDFFGTVSATISSLILRADGFSGVVGGTPPKVTALNRTGQSVDILDGRLYTLNTVTSPTEPLMTNEITGVKLNAARELNLPFYARLQTGLDIAENARDLRAETRSWSFRSTGTATERLVGTYDLINDAYSSTRTFNNGDRVRWIDPAKVYHLFQQQPSYFVLNETSAYTSRVNGSLKLKETVSAGYLRGDMRLLNNRLWLVGGVRYERTDDEGRGPLNDLRATYQQDANGNLIRNAAGVPLKVSTDALTLARLQYKERGSYTKKHYDDFYPSLNASYTLSENFVARAAYASTIGRPDLASIIPTRTVADPTATDANRVINTTNAALKPWSADNFDVTLETYSVKGATVSVAGFRKDISGFFTSTRTDATLALLTDMGLPDDYLDYDVITTANSKDPVHVTGLEWSWRQSLKPFAALPAWVRGLQLWANGTHLRLSGAGQDNFDGYAPRIINFGATYTTARFLLKYNVSRIGRTRASLDAVSSTVPAGTYQAQETRMVMDGSIEYRFDRRFAFYASVRNLANEPRPLITVSPNAPAYTQPRSYTYYGALWTIGVKGTF